MNRKKIELLISKINEKEPGSIFFLGQELERTMINRVSTGIADLDWAMGGGFPTGTVIEIFGAEDSAKTSLALHLCSRVEMSVYLDLEGTVPADRIALFGNTSERFIISQPDSAEDTIEKTVAFANAGMPIIVIDSLPFMVSRKRLEEKNVEKKTTYGGISGILSEQLPIIKHACKKNDSTLIFINQIRDNLKAKTSFSDPYSTPGGHALKHTADMRIRLSRKQWLKHDKLGVFGQISVAKIVKSKVCSPQKTCELVLIYDRGFIRHEDLNSVRDQLIEKSGQKVRKAKKVKKVGETS